MIKENFITKMSNGSDSTLEQGENEQELKQGRWPAADEAREARECSCCLTTEYNYFKTRTFCWSKKERFSGMVYGWKIVK